MRRPTRVTNARCSMQRRLRQHAGQVVKFALGPAALNMTVDQRGNTGAVIASVCQTIERAENERRRLPGTDNSDDSAHGLLLSYLERPRLNRLGEREVRC